MSINIDWMEPGTLACGGIPTGMAQIEALHHEGIRAIVTLTERPITVQTGLTAKELAERGFQLFHAPVDDFQSPTRGQAEQVASFIHRMRSEQSPIYMHCFAGIGRTGTMLHAFYLLEGMKLPDVIAKIKAIRPASQFALLSPTQQAFLQRLAQDLAS